MELTVTDPTAWPTARDGGGSDRARGRHLTLLAGEAPVGYDHAAVGTAEPEPEPESDTTSAEAPVDAVPFGCPVLAELPELAATLDRVTAADRLLVDAVLQLRPLLAEGRIEATTGIGIEHWLAATARMAGLDRRLLRRLCRLLDRVPSLARGAADGRVSFTQLRALALELRRAPSAVDEHLDAWLAAAIEQLPDDADPDVLVRQAARAVDELAPQVLDEDADEESRFGRGLVIQPNLTGTGGTFHGTEDAIGLAVLEAATAPRQDQLENAARGRADNLRAHLSHALAGGSQEQHGRPGDALPGPDADRQVDDAAPAVRVPGAAGPAASPTPPGPPALAAPPTLLLRWDHRALLEDASIPADILTRLVGGRLRLSSRHARELIEMYGARVRSVIVDEGEVVGVGRTTRVPPGWLRDAVLSIHDTCSGPLCDRPALGADLDHATPWHPDGDGSAGATDLDNLGPLCATTNRDRRASGWRPDQTRAGGRTWHHPRSGVRLTSLPATWRPRGIPPPPGRHPAAHRHTARPERSAPDDTVPF